MDVKQLERYDRIRKKFEHWDKSEFTEILTFDGKPERDESYQWQEYFALLGFDFQSWALRESSWIDYGWERQFNFDAQFMLDPEGERKVLKQWMEAKYQVRINHKENKPSKLSALVELKNWDKAGQVFSVGLDMSPWFSWNITGEYEFVSDQGYVLQRLYYKGRTRERSEEQTSNLPLPKDFSFLLPEIIPEQDNSFTLTHLNSNEPLLHFPSNLSIQPYPAFK
jgi:hypothetical protein